MAEDPGTGNSLSVTLRGETGRSASPWGMVGKLVSLGRKKPLGAVSAGIIAIVVLAALLADLIAPYDPIQMHGAEVLNPPSRQFPLGTDHLGRDLMSRIVHGARISLAVGLGAVGLSMILGVPLGMASAYFGGRLDMSLQRVMDALQAFPGVIFALAILAALGPSLINVTIAISFGLVPRNNRVVRGAVLTEKNNVYVDAARAIGGSENRLMWRHIFPNVTAPIIIIAATELGSAILSEASLSFLGLGVPAPLPSWGSMLGGKARTYLLAAPWTAIFPGVAISMAVLGWNLLGDALRDIWDPRLRGR